MSRMTAYLVAIGLVALFCACVAGADRETFTALWASTREFQVGISFGLLVHWIGSNCVRNSASGKDRP